MDLRDYRRLGPFSGEKFHSGMGPAPLPEERAISISLCSLWGWHCLRQSLGPFLVWKEILAPKQSREKQR